MKRPTDTECIECHKIFQQPVRSQGGGRHSIYCSPKCASIHWIKGNRGKRQATILKYEEKPESQDAKKERSLKYKFKKYNITEYIFSNQLDRQNRQCLGCGNRIDRFSARIDHNHNTGKFRGLLCNSCNWVLGHAYDKRETLYKLSAYLSYNPEKISVYLISSLRNPMTPAVAKKVRESGFHVWDTWYSAGPKADDCFQKYHEGLGNTFIEALKSEVANHIFYFDKAHLDSCDAGILLLPAGRSCHLELGYLAARNKKTYILLDKTPKRFDIMPQFATSIHNNLESMLDEMKKDLL